MFALWAQMKDCATGCLHFPVYFAHPSWRELGGNITHEMSSERVPTTECTRVCMKWPESHSGTAPEAGDPAESEAVWICFHFQLSLLAAASGLQGAIFDTSRSRLCGKSQRAALLHIALARQPDGSKAKHVVHQEKKEPLLLLFVLFLMWKSHPVGMGTAANCSFSTS